MKKLKILLAAPISNESSPTKTPPLGIIFTGAAVEQAGYEVNYWVEYIDSKKTLSEMIDNADVVGVSSFTGIQIKYATRILKLAKDKNKITVFGGIHANLTYDQCIQEEFIDYVAVGEGERTLLNLLEHLEGKLEHPHGIVSKKFSLIPVSPLGDFISPITDKTIRMFEYSNKTNNVLLPSSRGCPYKCGFCINSKASIGRYRLVNTDVWESWMNELEKRIKLEWLVVGDDYFGNQKRVLSIGNILKNRNIKFMPSCRADNFKKNGEQFAIDLKNIGVTTIAIGIESGSDRILQLIDKGEKKEDMIHCAKCISSAGIKAQYYFIIGFPTETMEERHQTFDLADQLYNTHGGDCLISMYNFTPFPGATLYDLAILHGMKVPQKMKDWENFTVSNSGTPEFQNIYHIAGMHFHQNPGENTDKNFPGMRRMIIRPFEKICSWRWKHRYFKNFFLEKKLIEFIIKYLRKK